MRGAAKVRSVKSEQIRGWKRHAKMRPGRKKKVDRNANQRSERSWVKRTDRHPGECGGVGQFLVEANKRKKPENDGSTISTDIMWKRKARTGRNPGPRNSKVPKKSAKWNLTKENITGVRRKQKSEGPEQIKM